ncbi:MAG: YggS family pyridoxal phosphate-dependent enzyme [Acidimicrobiales bacterium]
MTVAENVERTRGRIAEAGGDPNVLKIVAVTKGQGLGAQRAALAAGVFDLGESYAQELAPKAAALDDEPVRWHFIGQLQRNKVRRLAHAVTLWQSVDRLSLGAEIARHAPGAAVLVQVDLSGGPGRGGAPPELVPGLVAGLVDLGLDVRGLMAVGPPGRPVDAAAGFATVVGIADRLGLVERSIGMSADLEVAVAAGSTMVRIGTALFGERSRFSAADVEN